MAGVAIYYVFYGKFHEVAFRRIWRALEPMERECKRLNTHVAVLTHVYPRPPRRVLEVTERKIYVALVFLIATLPVLVVVAMAYVLSLMKTLFAAVIIWKGFDQYDLNIDELYQKLRNVREILAQTLYLPWIGYMIQPFIRFLVIISRINVDLGAVEVTCKGMYSFLL